MSYAREQPKCAPWSEKYISSQTYSRGPKPSRRLLWLMLLALGLPACGSQRTVEVTRTVVLSPPAEMMADCQRPDVDLTTNSAITDSLLAAHAALVSCNATKRAARAYIEDAGRRLATGKDSH